MPDIFPSGEDGSRGKELRSPQRFDTLGYIRHRRFPRLSLLLPIATFADRVVEMPLFALDCSAWIAVQS
jgi:hypothetical protein